MTSPIASPAIPKRGLPVTIITGFLGSGKTTLLNHILTNNQNLKVAILVNEFGDIDIDSQLLVSVDQDMMQLSNGCICCTINDDLVDAVYNVLEQDNNIDYLVIETTGVADPLPILLTFLGTELRDLTRLDSVITLVDASAFAPDLFDSEVAFKQITYSDMILLNKTDLVPGVVAEKLESHIQTLKDGARIIRCQNASVPLPLILDVGFNDPMAYDAMISLESAGHGHDDHDHDQHEHDHHGHNHQGHDHHSHHLENDGFVSVSYRSDRPFALRQFEQFLETLPTEVFRAKGLLWFNESPNKHIFQLSGKRCTLDVQPWHSAIPGNQVVFIGRHLDADDLRQRLADCQVSAHGERCAVHGPNRQP
jgi:G3E family GTPase